MNNPEGLSNCQQPVNVYTPTCGHTKVCPYRLDVGGKNMVRMWEKHIHIIIYRHCQHI